MTNLSYMALERRELQHQQLLRNQEEQLASDCDDLLHDFMLCKHDDAVVWDRFTQRAHELKEVLRQRTESEKRLQEYCAKQMLTE